MKTNTPLSSLGNFGAAIGQPAMDNPRNPEDELKPALSQFETDLMRPIVSGELAAWIEVVKKSWTETSAQVHYQVKHLHPRQYDEMGKQDPELLPRIDLLTAEDNAIEEEREHFALAVARVVGHAAAMEPDEEKAEKHIKQLVDDGIAFLTRVRKQEVAVQTWYIEAFDRDRGAVD
jgi:hypothetical protein